MKIQISPLIQSSTKARYSDLFLHDELIYKPHRSPDVIQFINETKINLLRILGLEATHDVAFLSSSCRAFYAYLYQQCQPVNAACVNTGYWSRKACDYINAVGSAVLVDKPESHHDWVHMCECETISGQTFTEFYKNLSKDTIVSLDATGSLLAESLDRSRADFIYASSGKHFSLPGMLVCLVSHRVKALLPDMPGGLLQYCDGEPVTPPVPLIRLLSLKCQDIIDMGIENYEARIRLLSDYIYDRLESSSLFMPLHEKNRSRAIIVFSCIDAGLYEQARLYEPGLVNHSALPQTFRLNVSCFETMDEVSEWFDKIEASIGGVCV